MGYTRNDRKELVVQRMGRVWEHLKGTSDFVPHFKKSRENGENIGVKIENISVSDDRWVCYFCTIICQHHYTPAV